MQAPPPSAALVELKGALRYHGTGARNLAGVLSVGTISCLGVDARVGLGPTVTVAATASAQVEAPGGVLAVDPDQAVAWLASLPVETLHGIVGPRQAAVLRDHGVHNLGLLAAIPPATVQRLMGGRASRLASTAPAASPHARSSSALRPPPPPPARPSPATPWMAPKSAPRSSTRWSVSRCCCAAAARRPVPLTLTLRFASGSTWEKTRRLGEPSHRDDDLGTVAYQLRDAAGLQCGRLTGLTLTGEDLRR